MSQDHRILQRNKKPSNRQRCAVVISDFILVAPMMSSSGEAHPTVIKAQFSDQQKQQTLQKPQSTESGNTSFLRKKCMSIIQLQSFAGAQ